jgi:hypothetical protein
MKANTSAATAEEIFIFKQDGIEEYCQGEEG